MLKQLDIESRKLKAQQFISRMNQAVQGGAGRLPKCEIFEDCKEDAVAICRARILCKQRGCLRRICRQHGVPLREDGIFDCCCGGGEAADNTTGL